MWLLFVIVREEKGVESDGKRRSEQTVMDGGVFCQLVLNKRKGRAGGYRKVVKGRFLSMVTLRVSGMDGWDGMKKTRRWFFRVTEGMCGEQMGKKERKKGNNIS